MAIGMKGAKQSDISKQSEIMKKVWDRPGYRENFSNKLRESWADPDSKLNSQETREKRSQRAKEQWEDPELREKIIRLAKERWANPDSGYHSPGFREKQSERAKEQWEDPEYREKMSLIAKEQWENPELREAQSKRVKEQWSDPEYRERMSRLHKELWENPEYRAKYMGENHHNWRGGISNEPYSFDFNAELRRRIRERDGSRCVLCGDPEDLCVHPINQDKMDSRPENLITLCRSCHGKVHIYLKR